MHGIDYGIVTVYLIAIVLIGLYLQRKASQGIDSYFLVNRNLPWWALASSGMSSNLDISGTMIIAALIVGSSILILADRMAKEPGFIGTLGIIGLILAGINTTGFIISYLLPRNQKE